MAGVHELAPNLGVGAACQAMGLWRALCRFVWNATLSFGQGGSERMSGQVFEF